MRARREPFPAHAAVVGASRRCPHPERRQQDGEIGARFGTQRGNDHVVEHGCARVRRAERGEDDVDRIARFGVEHLQPTQRRERVVRLRVGVSRGALERVAHGCVEEGALAGVHQSSVPRSRRRRAMMFRCTSAVPP